MILKRMSLQALPHPQVPLWGLVYDMKKDVLPLSLQTLPAPQVPPWGSVYDMKKGVLPPDPAYTLWCFGEERSVHLTHA